MIPSGRAPLVDPIDSARRAIQAGRYRSGLEELDSLTQEQRGTPEARLLTAMASWRLGSYDRSRATALQARDGFRRLNDFDGDMRAENVAAAAAFALGHLADAEAGFERAMTLADVRADHLMTGRCANNLGNVAYYLADADTALSHYRLAIAAFQTVGFQRGMAEAWLNSAIVLRETGDLAGSRDAADRAVGLAERAGDMRLKAQAFAAASETTLQTGDTGLASSLCHHASQLAHAEDDLLNEADTARIRARIDRMAGRYDEAWEAAGHAADIARGLGHMWTIAETEFELAEVARASSRPEEAKAHYRAAGEAFDRLGSRSRAAAVRRMASGN